MLRTRLSVFYIIFFILSALSQSAAAEEACTVQDCTRKILLEGKASYYLSTNKTFRDIYDGAGLYRAEISIQTWEDLFTWINVGYLYASGSTNLYSHTHIHLVPVSFGASYYFNINETFKPYLGIGPLLAYSYIHNSSQYVTHNQNGFGGGFLTKAGMVAYFSERYFLDFFADYSFIRMSFHHGHKEVTHHRGDLSGFSFGAGLGYEY